MLRIPPKLTVLVLALATPLAAGAQPASDAVGEVTSLAGDVRATGPDGASRALACGDPVYAGETVSTAPDASAGILMDQVLARVEGGTSLTVGRTGAGTPDAALERGRVRVIDARDGGAPARLAARNASVRVAGNDAEAYVLSEKVGPYAMFCEWDAPLAVHRGDAVQQADPGQCVIAKDREPLYVSDAHEERIPALGGETCPPELGGLVAPGPHFSAIDVALGPMLAPWSSLADDVEMPRFDPCDTPGSGCMTTRGIGGGIVIVEPDPGTGPRPDTPGPFGQ